MHKSMLFKATKHAAGERKTNPEGGKKGPISARTSRDQRKNY